MAQTPWHILKIMFRGYQEHFFHKMRKVWWKNKFSVRVVGTWRNRTLVLIRFQPSSSDSIPVPPHLQKVSSRPDSISAKQTLDWKSDLVRKNLVGSVEELEWNRRNLAGIRTEQGCLLLHVPSTLAPISLFGLPFLGSKSHLKEGRPWMTFLSRSNEGRRFFQFAIENFKRRPLISFRKKTNDWYICKVISSFIFWGIPKPMQNLPNNRFIMLIRFYGKIHV